MGVHIRQISRLLRPTTRLERPVGRFFDKICRSRRHFTVSTFKIGVYIRLIGRQKRQIGYFVLKILL